MQYAGALSKTRGQEKQLQEKEKKCSDELQRRRKSQPADQNLHGLLTAIKLFFKNFSKKRVGCSSEGRKEQDFEVCFHGVLLFCETKQRSFLQAKVTFSFFRKGDFKKFMGL